MRYLVISDLHCGSNKSHADDFADNDKNLIKWINAKIYTHQIDKIILNGDQTEEWQFRRKDILKGHKVLFDYFKLMGVEELIGNHNYKLGGKLTKKITCDNGKKVLISHGFQNDKAMTNPFTRFGVWLMGLIERIKPFKNIDNFADVLYKNKRSPIDINTERYALDKLNKFDIVICGHTHKQKIMFINQYTYRTYAKKADKPTPVKIYANCGTCQGGKFQGTILDTKNGKVTRV